MYLHICLVIVRLPCGIPSVPAHTPLVYQLTQPGLGKKQTNLYQWRTSSSTMATYSRSGEVFSSSHLMFDMTIANSNSLDRHEYMVTIMATLQLTKNSENGYRISATISHAWGKKIAKKSGLNAC